MFSLLIRQNKRERESNWYDYKENKYLTNNEFPIHDLR